MAFWLAVFRYGETTNKSFICREYLLPSELKRFKETAELPASTGKCLICSRYFHSYVYRLARNDPTFCPSANTPIQAFGNVIGRARGKDLPAFASNVGDEDGYFPSVMLTVDQDFTNTEISRGEMGGFFWHPVVMFHSSHYEYTQALDGSSRIVQVGVAAVDPQSFGGPTTK